MEQKPSNDNMGNNMANNPYAMSNEISQAGKDTYLRQSLLTVIANYNKTMKARNLMSSSNAFGPEKRKEVIKNALVSLLPENFQSPDGKPIEEASYLGTTISGVNTLAAKTSGFTNKLGTSWNNTMSSVPAFNIRKQGGRTKKGKKNRKNKNKKSRKSKY